MPEKISMTAFQQRTAKTAPASIAEWGGSATSDVVYTFRVITYD